MLAKLPDLCLRTHVTTSNIRSRIVARSITLARMSDRPLPPPPLIREELARVVDSDALRRAPSHMRLLRYLVEKRIAGDESALRETSIAREVFRRDPATYDPRTDPIVRVTIGRLRARLDSHYADRETPPILRIVLPKGHYAPEFVAVAGTARAPHGRAVLRT